MLMHAAIGPNCSSLALVARDWRGDLVFACSQKAKTTFPLQAKAKAIRWALSLAAKLEAENVIIETDSKICRDVIHELILPLPWRIASILADMHSLLVSYSNVSISWVPRLFNMAAHSLAKWFLACNFFGSFDWDSYPPCFASVVREEASHSLHFVSLFNNKKKNMLNNH